MQNVTDFTAMRNKRKALVAASEPARKPRRRKGKSIMTGVAITVPMRPDLSVAFLGGNVGGVFRTEMIFHPHFNLSDLGDALRRVQSTTPPAPPAA